MQFNSNTDEQDNIENQINMIPLIDIMLVLLIIFMIAMPSIVNTITNQRVELESNQNNEIDKGNSYTIRLDEFGKIYYENVLISEEEFVSKIKGIGNDDKLVLDIDSKVVYSELSRLLSLINSYWDGSITFVQK